MPVLEVDVLGGEHRFMEALVFEVAAPTAAEWIEDLFNRTNVLSRAAWTPQLSFAADTGRDFPQKLLLEEPISVETARDDVATDAWLSALCNDVLGCRCA